MCLHISQDQSQNEENLKKWFGSRKKFAYVYKVLQKWPDEHFYRSFYHPNYIWNFSKQKVYQVDRPLRPTKEELEENILLDFFRKYGAIRKGLHIYTDLRTTRYYLGKNRTIAKFRVNKKDLVTVNNTTNEAVCRKLTFVKIVEK
jgi:hypothetical protein